MSMRTNFMWIRGLVLTLCFVFPAPIVAADRPYGFELLGDGMVVARDGEKTTFPSVIRVPDWIAPAERADRRANYYLYYSTHHGDHIYMKWAESLDGPWTPFNLGGEFNGRQRRGVFDVKADPTRESYGHIAAPDVHVDNTNRRIIMYYHGENQPATVTPGGLKVPQVHQGFVATSQSGLNFNDPLTAGGEPGHGPQTVTVEGITRDIWIGPAYQRAFQHRGRWYSLSKRAIIAKARSTTDPWTANPSKPFLETWIREYTPSSVWFKDASQVQNGYHSPGATFLASSEFAKHPHNPNPGVRIASNDERLNHVSVCRIAGDRLEVFFWVRNDPYDRYDDIYRLVYDISDRNFENWEVARDESGQVLFDVVVTPEEITNAVRSANPNADPSRYADPISLGNSYIFVDNDGEKYLFFSFVSKTYGGRDGEGQIAAVRLIPAR